MIGEFGTYITPDTTIGPNFCTITEIEFPSIEKDGKFYTLDLSTIVETRSYKKAFVEENLIECLTYDYLIQGLCHAERWIVLNNPKYDYLYKEQKITL